MAATTEERRTARTLKVVEQHSRLSDDILKKLLLALLGLWGGFKGWDNPELVSGQAARSATLVDVSLAKTKRLARSYAETMLRDVDPKPGTIPPADEIYPRSGTNALDVYSRPAEVYLYAISQGKTDAEALKLALARVESLAVMDTALAERDMTSRVWSASKTVIGYRRLIHPEWSVSGTCGLCVVAATNFYSTDELMPLHHRCKCTSSPVTKGHDFGLKLNEHDLKAIYAAAGDNDAASLKKTRIAIKENGELGPMLVRDGQNFRDVDEVNKNGNGKTYERYDRPTIEQQRTQWAAMKASSIESVKKLKAARAAGETSVDLSGTGKKYAVKDWDAAIRQHQELIDRMSSKLR